MTPPLPPEKDIGPFYRAAGVLALIAFIATIVWQTYKGHAVDKFDLIRDGLILLLIFGLVRPEFVDNISKNLANWLPFFKFTKNG